MPIYNYLALRNNKEIVKGKVEAIDLRQARENVRVLGLLPTRITEDLENTKNREAEEQKLKLTSLSLAEKIDFSSTFQILIQSGVPVIEGLIFIENEASSPRVRRIAKELRNQIIAGSSFADTIQKYPEVFGRVFVGLAKAGEDSGEMEVTFERIIELLKKEDAIKGRVIGALIYPVFVICLAIVILLIMLMFVFPAFKEMFDNMNAELPIYTQICINAGTFLRKFWYTIPMALGSIVFGLYYAFKTPSIREKIDRYLLKVPIVGDMLKFADLSNFVAVMHVAYEAGIPVLDCLFLSNLTISNHILKNAVLESTQKVQQGMHLSMALKSVKVFPKMIIFMVGTGEQSGKLGDMLGQAVKYIDKRLDSVIDAMTKMIEPMMLIVIGSMVLFLALALYLPIFQSYAI